MEIGKGLICSLARPVQDCFCPCLLSAQMYIPAIGFGDLEANNNNELICSPFALFLSLEPPYLLPSSGTQAVSLRNMMLDHALRPIQASVDVQLQASSNWNSDSRFL